MTRSWGEYGQGFVCVLVIGNPWLVVVSIRQTWRAKVRLPVWVWYIDCVVDDNMNHEHCTVHCMRLHVVPVEILCRYICNRQLQTL
jgi:hypothetical protein